MYGVEIQEYNNGVRKALYIRSQHSVGASINGFGGPDTYVTVLRAGPRNHEKFPKILNARIIDARGFTRKSFGEGYKEHTGSRSMLGRAIEKAEAYMGTSIKNQ